MTGRELAWRVFAHELNASSEEEKGSGERSPSYVISPLGARMNRALVCGTISVPESAGGPDNARFWRSRLNDATGAVAVSAGAFQPRAQTELQGITSPTPVLVIGKATLFRGSGAGPVASIRAEAVRPLADLEFRATTTEIATQTMDRLDLVARLRGSQPPTDDELGRAGVPPTWILGARTSLLRYPQLDPVPFYESLRAVLTALKGSPPEAGPPSQTDPVPGRPAGVVRVVHPPQASTRAAPPPGFKALEGRLLEILDDLARESPDGYADMDDLSEQAARHGLEGERMEELLNYLSENGTLEEPLVGKFRRADGPPRE